MLDTTPRVALLIDADNISDKHAESLFKKAVSYGDIIVRKAYGQMGIFQHKWSKEIMLHYAIEPVVRYVAVAGKNTADIALVIEAMDLMNRNTVDTICIVSNDSDFSLLAMKLRENGIKVYGFGTEMAQKSFVAACDEFVCLVPHEDENGNEQETNNEQPKTAKTEKVKSPGTHNIEQDIIAACNSLYSDDDGWVHLGSVGKYLRRVNPSFSLKTYGFSSLKKLVENLESIDTDCDETTLAVYIRIKDTK